MDALRVELFALKTRRTIAQPVQVNEAGGPEKNVRMVAVPRRPTLSEVRRQAEAKSVEQANA